jgi:hypothetical protein
MFATERQSTLSIHPNISKGATMKTAQTGIEIRIATAIPFEAREPSLGGLVRLRDEMIEETVSVLPVHRRSDASKLFAAGGGSFVSVDRFIGMALMETGCRITPATRNLNYAERVPR